MNARIAAAAAQMISMAVFVTIARWYVVPWIRARGRGDALIPLLWVHMFRYVALQSFSAQLAGYPISDQARDGILYGDLLGVMLAAAGIISLRKRATWSIPLVWLLVAETAIDTVINASNGAREHLIGRATGLTWLVVSYYVPALLVSLGLIVWQLVSRRGEALHPVKSGAYSKWPRERGLQSVGASR